MAAILALTSVVRHFRGLRAIDGVDLVLQQGECLGLIGPNGAGKSTLFRLITGLLEADSGRIELQGRSLAGLPPERRFRLGLAWAFQHARCFPTLSAQEHLEVTLGGARGSAAGDVAAGWLDQVGLSAFAGEPAAGLSLSQRKLLDFARASCTDPAVLLLDEPFAGLAENEAGLLGACIDRVKRRGTTVLLVEHRLPELLEVVQEIAVLAGGKIIARGESHATLRSPDVLRAYFGVENA